MDPLLARSLLNLLRSYLHFFLSYAMLAGGLILKLPQILAVYKARSGEGLSLSSIYFETIGYTLFSLHNYFKGVSESGVYIETI